MKRPNLVPMHRYLCILILAASSPLTAEPPRAYILVVAAASGVDGIRGPQAGIVAGARAPLGCSVTIIVQGSVLHSPKIGEGAGLLAATTIDAEHRTGAWFGSAGASYAVQETSAYSKEAWSARFGVGRQIGSVRLWATWSAPDSTENRAESIAMALEWRPRRWILRPSASWLSHRDGEGLRLAIGFGRAWPHDERSSP